MVTIKARITNGEIFKLGDTVSVLGHLQSNGQWRYEVCKPIVSVQGGSVALESIADRSANWFERRTFFSTESWQTLSLGIVGSTHRADAGLGSIWANVRLLEPTEPDTWSRIAELGYELDSDLGGNWVRPRQPKR